MITSAAPRMIQKSYGVSFLNSIIFWRIFILNYVCISSSSFCNWLKAWCCTTWLPNPISYWSKYLYACSWFWFDIFGVTRLIAKNATFAPSHSIGRGRVSCYSAGDQGSRIPRINFGASCFSLLIRSHSFKEL